MKNETSTELETPRIEEGRAMVIAGFSGRYDGASRANIPAQWERFIPYMGQVPGQVGNAAYGVCLQAEAGGLEYVSGVEVDESEELPEELTTLRIPAQRYLVFTHREHISTIPRTHDAIWSKWLPASEHEPAQSPSFERYDDRFDPESGTGEVEIWVPIRER